MSERIYKLQPNRTISLRGFNDLGAAAALHSATANSFEVSGIFRDPADFCVLTFYDCDNFFEHPSLRHLPDTNFAGLTLDFDVRYTGLRNLDSPRYPIIDWPYLDVIRPDGTTANIPLFNPNYFVSGTWTAATAQFTFIDNGLRQWDRVTLWYLNRAFDYLVQEQLETAYAFTNKGAGFVHSITVAGTAYSHTEMDGDSDVTIAQRLVDALSSSPLVSAARVMNQVNLKAKPGDGHAFQLSSTAGQPQTLYTTSAASIAAEIARQCNTTDWYAAGADIPLAAQATGATVTFAATKKGVDGNALSIYAVSKNSQLTVDKTFAQFTGGSSDATWHVHIDFSAAGISQVRKMWLTFAPPLAIGAAFQPTEWRAQFSNWSLTGPEEVRRLVVAGPGSYRIEDSNSNCAYTGKWDVEAGFFSRGYAKVATQAGARVTIQYNTAVAHELWLGTSLYGDRGSVNVTIDGAALAAPFDAYLNTGGDPAVITRRKLSAALSAGPHVVVLETRDAKPFYFDFLEMVVPSDVPENLAPRANVSPALDYSTDHTYKLPPARIHWMLDKLGYAGPMNEYIGVFWWNQRTRSGAVIPQASVTFSGDFASGDQVWLNISGTRIGKSVFPTDSNETIARHFCSYVNATFVGLWASLNGNIVTLTSHSPAKDFQFDLAASIDKVTGSTGSVTIAGTLKYPPDQIRTGLWMVDPSQSPALNRGARDWHADFFRECHARNRTLAVAASMELVLPPSDLPARYHNGDPVKTDVGYGSDWWSSHCAFNSATLAYQKQVYDCIAGLMSAAGLPVELQFGEYCWWYFASKTDPSMAFYDADTAAAAQAALGRPLTLFRSPTDDPLVNGSADAAFLRNRLRDHVASLVAYLRGRYPDAKFELLFPYDVNYPEPAGVNRLGGRLLRFVNFPAEWQQKATSGFDRIKMEGLDWGAASRDLNLVRDVMEFPVVLGWPLDSIRYMLPIFNGGCPWISEYRLAMDLKIPFLNLWAFDHVCIFGLNPLGPTRTARAMRF